MVEYDSFEVSETFSVKPEVLFKAWLESNEHSAFTGNNEAVIDPKIGGKFTAWGGYISGKTLEIDPPKRILQDWRTNDFGSDDESSLLELIFEPVGKDKTRLMIKHSRIPTGQGEGYKQGWIDFYFKPMKEYFGSVHKQGYHSPIPS